MHTTRNILFVSQSECNKFQSLTVKMWQQKDLNSRPKDKKATALTTELWRVEDYSEFAKT